MTKKLPISDAAAPEASMNYRFVDLVDIDAFRNMLKSFFDATGILHGLVDHENNIISAIGWQEACTDFHRVHPLSNERCLESNRYLGEHLGEGAFVGCACKNGLMDYATPIVIEGQQLATLFFGQTLNKAPDMAFFRNLAQECGFDEDAYLAAIRKVPVVAEERIAPIMAFYVQLAQMLARSGLDRLRQKETEQRLADLSRELAQRVEERTAELAAKNSLLQAEFAERKRMEVVIDNERATLRAFFTALPEMAWMKDTEGRYLACNPVFESYFGAPEVEIVSKTDFDFVDAELAAFFHLKDKEAIIAGRPTVNEESVRFACDGRRALLETVKAPLRDAAGNVFGVLGIAHDITERKRLEEKLQYSFDALAEAQRIGHIGSWDVDIVNDVLTWSDETFRIWEIDKENFAATFEAFLNTVHPEDRERVSRAYNESIRNRTLYEIEHRLLFPDGRIKYILERGEPYFNADGKPLRFVGTSLEITERKRLESVLRDRERDFRSLAENLPDSIARWDTNGRYLYINPAHEYVLGASINDVIGTFIPDSHEHVKAAIAQVSATGQAVRMVRQAALVNGVVETHEVTLVPEFDEAGRVVSVLGIGRDMTEQIGMQEALRAREEQFRALFESAPDPIIRYDRECRRLYANPALERLIGFPVAKLLGATPLDISILPQESAEKIVAGVAHVVATGQPCESELEFIGRDGQRRLYLNRYGPEWGRDGQVAGVIAISMDITERKRLETELREQADFRQVLLDAMNEVGIQQMVIENGRIVHVGNRELARRFGYSDAEIDDHPLLVDIIHPDDRERVMGYYRRRMTGEAPPRSYELGLVTRAGERREFEISVVAVPGSHPPRLVTIGKDITERKRAQQQIELLDRAINCTSDAIFLAGEDMRFSYVNAAACRSLGYSREELLAMTPLDIDPDITPEGIQASMSSVVPGESFAFETRHRTKDGHIFPVEINATHFVDNGKRFGLTVAREITQRKVMEAAREAALNEAQRLAQMRSAFLARMSHELRTPLNGILGYAQNLLHDEAVSERQSAGLNIIQQSGDHLLGLINDLLDHAKIESDRLDLNIGDVSPVELLRAVEGIIRVRAEQKNLMFTCEADAALPGVIRGDGQRLRQVLLNLLSNAVKFTDSGQVSLRVQFSAPDRLRFDVSDSGVGIKEDQWETIFQPFEQAGDASRRIGGTGLGLAISRQLVGLMGGEIKVESRTGEGSTFSFEIAVEVVQSEPWQAAIFPEPLPPRQEGLLAPPRQELEVLHALAQRGNMRSILQRAAHLAELDQRYAPFAGQLVLLAKGYQSRAILSMVEQYLEQA